MLIVYILVKKRIYYSTEMRKAALKVVRNMRGISQGATSRDFIGKFFAIMMNEYSHIIVES